MKKFYVSTAIAYVNAPPHIGHSLEFIQADVLARYHRLRGDDTFFLTGTDEHGVKVYETAAKENIPTKDFADLNANKFENLCKTLSLSNDYFVRTTSVQHKAGARKMWQKLFDQGDIYKDVYKGNYCVGCEAYVLDKDLDESGNCPTHQKKPEILEEENYFFRLSKYSNKINKAIESDELLILPQSRKNEMLNLIGEDGLRDVSFSRPKEILPWGVDVPNDENQVMYVWCDALSNYITALDYENEGELFRKFWPCDVHIIGKDILRFHAGIWIGMLLSAEIPLPKAIYVHGFVTGEGQKMSKSLGNVVDPLGYIEKYGLDALRYYLLREIPTTDDGDFSHERFVNLYNSELANSLGNLVNRVLMMTDRYLEGKVPNAERSAEVSTFIAKIMDEYEKSFQEFDLRFACECLVNLTDFANKYIDEKKPWLMDKNGEDVSGVLYDLLEILRILAVLFYPILPDSALKIASQLGLKKDDLKFDKTVGQLQEGTVIHTAAPLFPRIDE
jgi:methionyl-tRNA synthetase